MDLDHDACYRAVRGRDQRSPGELRRARQPDASALERGELTLLLRYRPPYDWDAMLEFLRCRAIPGIEEVWHRTRRSRRW